MVTIATAGIALDGAGARAEMPQSADVQPGALQAGAVPSSFVQAPANPSVRPDHVTAWATSVHDALERQARRAVAAARQTFTQSGVASWYGYEFAGRRTSSGVRFNPMQLTCAHRTLPLGSRLLVTSEATGRSVVVTVTDRGPYAGPDRIIDLSKAAASRIGMVQDGLNNVTIERISPAGGETEVAQAADKDTSDQAIRAAN